MTSTARSSNQWDWIADSPDPWVLGINGCITFARGLSERRMLEVFEMDPDRALTMTVSEAENAMQKVPPQPEGMEP
jgi:hypothetical protein